MSGFDRIQPSTSHQCPFVFSRIAKGKIPKPSVFHRLKKDEHPKSLVFSKIKIGGMSSRTPSPQNKDSVFNRLGRINEVESSILSRMKHVSTLDVMVDDSLKVKRHILVLIGHGAKASSKERTKEEEQASSNCITSQEFDDFS